MNDVEPTAPEGQRKEPSSSRLVVTLGLAGMISGLALASVFQVTKPIIDRNNAEALRRAVYKVVSGSTTMQKLVLRDQRLIPVAEEDRTTEPAIYGAYDQGGRFLGYAIENNGPGFQDDIRLLYGYDPARKRVIGMEVLESRETPGLGDKIMKDPRFAANFADLAVEPEIVVVKKERTAENQVDAITGATISSRAVVKIINVANKQWLQALPAPGSEPALRSGPPKLEEESAANWNGGQRTGKDS